MKKILVLCSGYPSKENPYNCTWAHTRNRYYVENGFQVDVLSFGAPKGAYSLDGVSVVSKSDALIGLRRGLYDLVLSHSPNLRRHLPFLLNLGLPQIFFMHGSESMSINNDYPEPYSYMLPGVLERVGRDAYDAIKFFALREYILRNQSLLNLVFVSEWMKRTFQKNVLDVGCDNIRSHVINNSLGTRFLRETYSPNGTFAADFVVLRRLDDSKYCIDLIVESARANPNLSYHIFGKGRYFDFHEQPANVRVVSEHIPNDSIPEVLNRYRCALMPTRCDAQGVMVCEIAAYGMPVITSDIEVSQEMFRGVGNVYLRGLSEFSTPIDLKAHQLGDVGAEAKRRFALERTLGRELELIGSLA